MVTSFSWQSGRRFMCNIPQKDFLVQSQKKKFITRWNWFGKVKFALLTKFLQTLLQCILQLMTSAYTDFPKEPCPNMSSPCWIPQADSIIQKHTIRSLHQCDTIEKYKCMLNTIRYAKDKIDQQCKKPCKTETYTTNSLRNDLFPLWRASRKSVLK